MQRSSIRRHSFQNLKQLGTRRSSKKIVFIPKIVICYPSGCDIVINHDNGFTLALNGIHFRTLHFWEKIIHFTVFRNSFSIEISPTSAILLSALFINITF